MISSSMTHCTAVLAVCRLTGHPDVRLPFYKTSVNLKLRFKRKKGKSSTTGLDSHWLLRVKVMTVQCLSVLWHDFILAFLHQLCSSSNRIKGRPLWGKVSHWTKWNQQQKNTCAVFQCPVSIKASCNSVNMTAVPIFCTLHTMLMYSMTQKQTCA